MSHGKNASRAPFDKRPGRGPKEPPNPWARDTSDLADASKLPASDDDPARDAVRRTALLPGLHIVSTPIGNLSDISYRALETLRSADLILCEDTRNSRTLCLRYDIQTRLTPYHEHNAERMRPEILSSLAEGKRIALISDAGTPLVSDPGFKLVREAIGMDLPVHAVPGASALLSALVLSGLPTDRFLFAGFLPPKETARRRSLTELAAVPATLIFYETAPRLAASLADMAAVLGDRAATVSREITKLHEETRRAALSELARHYEQNGPPRGEIVIVTGPPLAAAPPEAAALDEALLEAIERDGLRDAATAIAHRFDRPRREIYARALALTKSGAKS